MNARIMVTGTARTGEKGVPYRADSVEQALRPVQAPWSVPYRTVPFTYTVPFPVPVTLARISCAALDRHAQMRW